MLVGGIIHTLACFFAQIGNDADDTGMLLA